MYSYNILDFGAVCSAEQLQTAAIQCAIDTCYLNGGGKIIVPAGTFLTGGLRLRSNCTLHLQSGAVLLGSRNPEDYYGYRNDEIQPLRPEQVTDSPFYHWFDNPGRKMETEYDPSPEAHQYIRIPGSRWNNAIIRAIDAENIAIIGDAGAVIDGANCFDDKGSEENYRGPHGIAMHNTKNIRLSGYTIQHTGNWAHNLLDCSDIYASGFTVLAGHDGIHMNRCRNIVIEDCKFYTGDDCIAGFANNGMQVRRCEINSACSAFRFGGTNACIEDCHIFAPCRYGFRGPLSMEDKRAGVIAEGNKTRTNMLSVFTYYCDYSVKIPDQPGNIVMRNCRIEGADRFLHYNYSGSEPWQRQRPLQDITFENITAEDLSMPLSCYGGAELPVELTMKNIRVRMRNGAQYPSFINLCNFFRVTMENVEIENFHADCLIRKHSDGEICLKNVSCGLDEAQLVQHTDEEFVIYPI